MHSKMNQGYPNNKGVDSMPKDSQNTHSQSFPHPDGPYDRVIQDSGEGLDKQIGVVSGPTDELKQEKNPFDFNFKQNQTMEKLNRFVNGKDVE